MHSLLQTRTHFKQEVNFSEEVFFLFLLPPIIFESGYNLDHTKAFFGNFGAICMLALYVSRLSRSPLCAPGHASLAAPTSLKRGRAHTEAVWAPHCRR